MAVPLSFTAVEIAGQIFVDGETVFDCPLMGFGRYEIGNTLGLAFARSLVVATENQEDKEFGNLTKKDKQVAHRGPRKTNVILSGAKNPDPSLRSG
jgi:hypothetical protein